MRIRLFAGLLAAVVLTACSHPVAAPVPEPADATFDGDPPPPPPPPDTATNRSGGTMGSGN